jgi:hypothetical protein
LIELARPLEVSIEGVGIREVIGRICTKVMKKKS